MMLGQSAWSLGSGLELIFADLPAKELCLDLMIIGVAITPPSLLVFVLRFTGRDRGLTRRRLALIGGVALATILVTWTNPWHHLYYLAFRRAYFHGAWTGVQPRGPLFWANVTYLYILMAAATILLIREAVRSVGSHLARAGLLLLGMLLPWTIN